MNSAYCRAQIKSYSDIKNQLLSINNDINDCIYNISSGEKIVELLIIDGEQIGGQLLKESKKTFGNVKTDLSTLVKECDSLITKYQNLLDEALKRENVAVYNKTTKV